MAYLSLDTWRLITSAAAQPGVPTEQQDNLLDSDVASVIALQAEPGAEIEVVTGDLAAGFCLGTRNTQELALPLRNATLELGVAIT